MARDYETKHDMDLRLDRTICFYNDEPVYVACDRHQYPTVDIYDLRKGNYSKPIASIDHRSDLFSDRPPKLGYCDLGKTGDSAYLKRFPSRIQSQGLTIQSICTVPHVYFSSDTFFSQRMYNCIMGVHAGFDWAIREINRGARAAVSIHRHMAVERIDSRRLGLMYKARLVGIINSDTSAIDWFNDKDILIIRTMMEKTGCLPRS
jgi:hypothetical protein